MRAAINDWLRPPAGSPAEPPAERSTRTGVFHPTDMPDGCTTIWYAAMELTGHDPLYAADLPLFGQYATEEKLEEWMRFTVQRNPGNTTFDLYSDLRSRLDDGRILPVVAAYRADGRTYDPWRTLISKSDAQAVFDVRQNPRLPEIAVVPVSQPADLLTNNPAPSTGHKKTGPKPKIRTDLTYQMMTDYKNDPAKLEKEKLVTLQAKYSSKPTSTRDAKQQALQELRKNAV